MTEKGGFLKRFWPFKDTATPYWDNIVSESLKSTEQIPGTLTIDKLIRLHDICRGPIFSGDPYTSDYLFAIRRTAANYGAAYVRQFGSDKVSFNFDNICIKDRFEGLPRVYARFSNLYGSPPPPSGLRLNGEIWRHITDSGTHELYLALRYKGPTDPSKKSETAPPVTESPKHEARPSIVLQETVQGFQCPECEKTSVLKELREGGSGSLICLSCEWKKDIFEQPKYGTGYNLEPEIEHVLGDKRVTDTRTGKVYFGREVYIRGNLVEIYRPGGGPSVYIPVEHVAIE